MTPADIIAALALAALIVGGIIHLHVKVAELRVDVKWIKQRVRELGPHLGWPEGS